jgi:hypothetical protein
VVLAGVVVVAALVRPDLATRAQVDPCSLITTDEVAAVTGADEVQATPAGQWCSWSGTTADGGFVDVQLMPDVLDAEQYLSGYPYDAIEISGFPGFRFAEPGIAMIAVKLPTCAPWISVVTVADLDTSAAAISL